MIHVDSVRLRHRSAVALLPPWEMELCSMWRGALLSSRRRTPPEELRAASGRAGTTTRREQSFAHSRAELFFPRVDVPHSKNSVPHPVEPERPPGASRASRTPFTIRHGSTNDLPKTHKRFSPAQGLNVARTKPPSTTHTDSAPTPTDDAPHLHGHSASGPNVISPS